MLSAARETLAPTYRGLRRLKNQALNLFDAPVVVLAYHRIAHLPSDPHQLAVTPENFRAHLQHLRRACRCVCFDEDWSALRERAVAVTFDDGYADNAREALPILEQAGVPATFFISTGTIGTSEELWSDDLERLVLGGGDRPPVLRFEDQGREQSWPSASPEQRGELHSRLHGLLLRLGRQQRGEWLTRLRAWAGCEPTGRLSHRAMALEELQALAASPVATVGAHGVTHTPLALLGEEDQRREIFESRRQLEAWTGRTVEVFSYPFGGRGQFDKTTVRLCGDAGFRRAVTTLPGQVHRWTHPLRTPRQLVRNWDAETFAARLAGFWA